MKDILTVQSNKLTLSKINFENIYEKRILFAIVDSISPHLKGILEQDKTNAPGNHINYEKGIFEIDRITYKANSLEKNRQHYHLVRNALKTLKERSIPIKFTNGDEILTSLILKYEWKFRDDVIKISIDRDLYDLLVDLTSGYAKIQVKTALSLSSLYSMKIYELIAKFRGKKKFYMSIEDLRFITNTESVYKKVIDFKKWVLDVAKKELDNNKITDLRFNYNQVKKGRKIIGFDFFPFTTNNSYEFKKKEKEISPFWTIPKEIVDELKAIGINLKGKNIELIEKYVKHLDNNVKEVLNKIRYFEEVGEKTVGLGDKLPGYIIGTIKKELETN